MQCNNGFFLTVPNSPAIQWQNQTMWFSYDATQPNFSSASSPQHFWDPCIFCRRTNSLEFTDWSSEQFMRDLKTLTLRNRALQINIYLLICLLQQRFTHVRSHDFLRKGDTVIIRRVLGLMVRLNQISITDIIKGQSVLSKHCKGKYNINATSLKRWCVIIYSKTPVNNRGQILHLFGPLKISVGMGEMSVSKRE